MHFQEIRALAEKAWNKVRGDDPVWNECSQQHRETRTEEARCVVEKGGGSNVFELEVARLLSAPEPKSAPPVEPETPKPSGKTISVASPAPKPAKRRSKAAPKKVAKKQPSALDKIKQSVVDTFSTQDKPLADTKKKGSK